MRHVYIISDPSGSIINSEINDSMAAALRSVRGHIGGRVYKSEWFPTQRDASFGDREDVQMGEACLCYRSKSECINDHEGSEQISINKFELTDADN